MTADIVIEHATHRKNAAGEDVAGARVTVANIGCPVLKNIRNAQRFIDIGKAASALAHGVRNPLSAVKGAVLYISEKYPKERVLTEFAEIMDEEIRKFDKFISKFLSESLFDEEPVLTDVNSLLRKIQVMTSFQTHFYRIRTVYEYGDIPPVWVNSFQFEHAILNIINNAIEVMRAGGRLTVKTRLESFSGGNYIIVEISDTGPGMFESNSPRYAPMEGAGKGFGLLITREILQHYGGHLEIKGRKGKGTVAILYIAADKRGEGK
jgi:two-component system nitrogen regulation sensor histidine kinase GlnL